MGNENTFRWVLLAGVLVVLPIVLYHRIRSLSSRERLDRMQEGLFILITLRLAGLGTLVGVLAYLVNPSKMAWASVPLPDGVRWTGVGLLAICALLLAWTLSSLGRNLPDTVVTRKEHSLVTTGPYRWVRHPFYVSALLMASGCAVLAANGMIFGCGLTVFTLMAVRTQIEERKLIERFGDQYRRYMKSTGAFFPRLSRH